MTAPRLQPVSATPQPWTISEVRSVEGEYLIVGGEGQEFGLIASCPVKADAEAIVAAQARIEELDGLVDLLESNARVQAKLLADTGRRSEELELTLKLLRNDPAVPEWIRTLAIGTLSPKGAA